MDALQCTSLISDGDTETQQRHDLTPSSPRGSGIGSTEVQGGLEGPGASQTLVTPGIQANLVTASHGRSSARRPQCLLLAQRTLGFWFQRPYTGIRVGWPRRGESEKGQVLAGASGPGRGRVGHFAPCQEPHSDLCL